ncbi:MAG: C4-dicarboxylate TRAP transporter substrate-binding protein [Alphaproteobacteria bacterium]|nr:C4-dicarboxylate TRAP transporter substrate-binding protein [Alphaproteobacteria bacterium]
MASRKVSGAAALAIATAVGATVAASTPAAAQETITLTAISGYPPVASWVKALVEVYMPTVNAELAKTGNYKISWNEGVSGQIVKPRGELEGIETGLGDLGTVVTAFHPDKIPLYKLTFVTPFVSSDLGLVVKTIDQLEQQIPAFAKGWEKFNQVNLVNTGAVDDYMVLSKDKITSLDDFSGKKLGAAGANLPWVTALGAAGVQTNLADAYNSMTTGIYEGGIFWAEAAGGFKLCEPAPFFLDGNLGAVQSHNISVNSDVWEGLPEEVRNALKAASAAHQQAATDFVVNGASKGIERCKKEFGSEVTVLSPEDRTKWAMALDNAAKEWAEDLEGQGIPGKQVLSAYMDAMRAANQPIERHWDRE